MDPKGKVALVTGGARIGQVVAHSLAARGCDLALVYGGSREAAEASAKAAINAGVRAISIRADAVRCRFGNRARTGRQKTVSLIATSCPGKSMALEEVTAL